MAKDQYSLGQVTMRTGGMRGGRGSFTVSQNAYHPIKPLTAPSQPDYASDIKKSQPKPPVRNQCHW